MRFSIITPTYKRAEKLKRAVLSLQSQTYSDWELVIVNDSPDDRSYEEFASSISDPRIRYYINKTNSGVNFSRNFALEKLSADSDWVLLLDDDDYFAPDTLRTFADLITHNPHHKWFVTNRALKDGTSVTYAKKSDRLYSYAWSYLIFKRFRGDATHCMETKSVHDLFFSKFIRQGEEWIFFYELGLTSKMFYHDHNSTITEGYAEGGLNFRPRKISQKLADTAVLFFEGASRGLWYRPSFLVYFLGRLIMIFSKAIRKKA